MGKFEEKRGLGKGAGAAQVGASVRLPAASGVVKAEIKRSQARANKETKEAQQPRGEEKITV